MADALIIEEVPKTGVICHPGQLDASLPGAVLVALLFDASRDDEEPTAIFPLVAGLDESVSGPALDFFTVHAELLINSLELFADIEAMIPATIAIATFPSIEALFEDAGELVREVPSDETMNEDGWAAFLATLAPSEAPVVLPVYSSRAVHRHMVAMRAMREADRNPGLIEDARRLREVVSAFSGDDVRLVAIAEDYRDALAGNLKVSDGYSVVVSIFGRQRIRSDMMRRWENIGGVDVVVAFGLTAEQAGHVLREVVAEPGAFVHGDVRLIGNEEFVIEETPGSARIVRDVDLDWTLTDPTSRRDFMRCSKLVEKLAHGADQLRQREGSSQAR